MLVHVLICVVNLVVWLFYCNDPFSSLLSGLYYLRPVLIFVLCTYLLLFKLLYYVYSCCCCYQRVLSHSRELVDHSSRVTIDKNSVIVQFVKLQ